MRKILKWVGITVLILLITLISLPFIFKGKLIEIVKQEVNNSVKAQVDWGDFDLTLFSSFPDFSFDIQDVKVAGVDEFEGITLAAIKNTSIDLDLMSVLRGGKIKIKSILIENPEVNVIVNKDTLANYDIVKSSEEEVDVAADTSVTEYEIGLNTLIISNANISYDDKVGNMSSVIKNMDLELSGDFTQDIFDVLIASSIQELTVSDGPVSYLNKTNVTLNAGVNIDKFETYTLKENTLKLNELELGFNGFVELLAESMNMDLTFNSKQTEFKNILSLVPAVYMSDFESVKTKGKFELKGMMKGEMKGEDYPEFDISMAIDEGYFKYPDLPNSVTNIDVKTRITHPQGDLDLMVLDISKFSMKMADNPLKGNLKVAYPMTDPLISSEILTKLDLAKLGTVIPMGENEKLNGTIDADIVLAGRLSSIEKEEYQNFKAEGDLVVSNMQYASKDLPYEVMVNAMEMKFSPQYVDLKNLDTKIGNSDIQAKGKIDNILPYVFNNEVLKGSMHVTSTMLDVDDLMRTVEGETETKTEISDSSAAYEVIKVPGAYDLNLTTDIKQMIYDGTFIKNIRGAVSVKDKVAKLSDVNLDMLEGKIVLNGSYNTQKTNPVVNFDYDVKGVDIEQTAAFFGAIETIAPILKKCKGKISTNMKVSTELDQNMEPVYNTINGAGGLLANNLTVEGIKSLEKIADLLKVKELATQSEDKLKLAFSFTNGRAIVNPFDVKLSGINSTISGSTGFDQTIEYDVAMQVPKAKLGNKANEVAESLFGKAKLGGKQFTIPDVIPVKFKIGGTVTNPKVVGGLKDKASSMVTDVKDKVADTIKKTYNAQIDNLMNAARGQGDKLKQEAKAQADKLREEGRKATQEAKNKADEIAKEAKKKAEEEADKLANKGANPFEKIANKKLAEAGKKKAIEQIEKTKQKAYTQSEIISNQAEEKADKLEAEADKQAQKILDAAQIKADGMKK
ncbi:MAG: AsmA-like C-terminal region-containing protein [Flavobacteriales bacterium]